MIEPSAGRKDLYTRPTPHRQGCGAGAKLGTRRGCRGCEPSYDPAAQGQCECAWLCLALAGASFSAAVASRAFQFFLFSSLSYCGTFLGLSQGRDSSWHLVIRCRRPWSSGPRKDGFSRGRGLREKDTPPLFV